MVEEHVIFHPPKWRKACLLIDKNACFAVTCCNYIIHYYTLSLYIYSVILSPKPGDFYKGPRKKNPWTTGHGSTWGVTTAPQRPRLPRRYRFNKPKMGTQHDSTTWIWLHGDFKSLKSSKIPKHVKLSTSSSKHDQSLGFDHPKIEFWPMKMEI